MTVDDRGANLGNIGMAIHWLETLAYNTNVIQCNVCLAIYCKLENFSITCVISLCYSSAEIAPMKTATALRSQELDSQVGEPGVSLLVIVKIISGSGG